MKSDGPVASQKTSSSDPKGSSTIKVSHDQQLSSTPNVAFHVFHWDGVICKSFEMSSEAINAFFKKKKKKGCKLLYIGHIGCFVPLKIAIQSAANTGVLS